MSALLDRNPADYCAPGRVRTLRPPPRRLTGGAGGAVARPEQAHPSRLDAELRGLHEHGFPAGLVRGLAARPEDRLARDGRHLGLLPRPEALVPAAVLDAASGGRVGRARGREAYAEPFRLRAMRHDGRRQRM